MDLCDIIFESVNIQHNKMQRKKNITLLIIFLILLTWTIVYLNLENEN